MKNLSQLMCDVTVTRLGMFTEQTKWLAIYTYPYSNAMVITGYINKPMPEHIKFFNDYPEYGSLRLISLRDDENTDKAV